VDVKQVSRELGVRYLLEGSVRKAGNRARVSAQLIDGPTGHHIWAEYYDRELADIFAVQDEITDRVMGSIAPQLYAAEGVRARRKPPESLDAWERVARALALINERTKAETAQAQALLGKAIELDAGYAQAYSLLAFVLALNVHFGWEPRERTLPVAIKIATEAMRLDSDDPWSHAALGFVLAESRRVAEAVAEHKAALALNPNFAYGYTTLGAACCYLGRCEEAMSQIEKAERLSPCDLLTRGNRGANNVMRAAACLVADRFREGADFARKAILENSASIAAYRQLVINSALAGELEEAKLALGTVKRLQPDISLKWIEEWVPFVRAEDRRKYVEGFRLAGLD
jgi:tetratricopeptide (TPR) repeat protein